MQKIWLLGSILVTVGCSQRAAWRVIPSAPVPANASVERPRQQSEQTSVTDATPLDAATLAHLGTLMFPVPGVDSTRLDDSFDDPRDGGGRRHNAIDIMAPRGTPVLSVQDGRILRLSKNAKGGNSIYATDLEGQFVYYYAHLDRYHPNVYNGKPLVRGDTIGFVGTTGNAPATTPHLHFQVMRMPSDHKFWDGDPINPYPLLRRTATTSAAGK